MALIPPPVEPAQNRQAEVRIVSIDVPFSQVILLVSKVLVVAFPFVLSFSVAITLVLSFVVAAVQVLF